ncbi:MAG: hypothetical protein RL194_243 [Pseudomonadota bacterium]
MINFNIKTKLLEKQLRIGKRITIVELANETGVNRVTLYRLMQEDTHNITLKNLIKLCDYFECSLDELVKYTPGRSCLEFSSRVQSS